MSDLRNSEIVFYHMAQAAGMSDAAIREAIDTVRQGERSTVRGWHPKCATCNSAYVAREKYVSVNRCAMGVDIQNTDLSEYYCSDHTDFDSPMGKD